MLTAPKIFCFSDFHVHTFLNILFAINIFNIVNFLRICLNYPMKNYPFKKDKKFNVCFNLSTDHWPTSKVKIFENKIHWKIRKMLNICLLDDPSPPKTLTNVHKYVKRVSDLNIVFLYENELWKFSILNKMNKLWKKRI